MYYVMADQQVQQQLVLLVETLHILILGQIMLIITQIQQLV
jgi:hypothetical protein